MLAVALLLAIAPLDAARAHLAKGEFQPALDGLKDFHPLDDRQGAQAAALQASALLGLGNRQAAADALAAMWHLDQSGGGLSMASDGAKALAQELRSERALVLHDREPVAPSGRPLRIRARLAGAHMGDAQLFVHFRADGMDDYVSVQMDPAATGDELEAWLRPGVGAMPAGGDHILQYYIEAVGNGAVLDSNGTAAQPLAVALSTRTAAPAAAIQTLDEGGRPVHPLTAPPPTPWYKRWEIMAPAGGVLLAGGITALLLMQPKPQPANGSLGRVDLP